MKLKRSPLFFAHLQLQHVLRLLLVCIKPSSLILVLSGANDTHQRHRESVGLTRPFRDHSRCPGYCLHAAQKQSCRWHFAETENSPRPVGECTFQSVAVLGCHHDVVRHARFEVAGLKIPVPRAPPKPMLAPQQKPAQAAAISKSKGQVAARAAAPLKPGFTATQAPRVFGQPAVCTATPPGARPQAPAKPLTPQQRWLNRRPWGPQSGTNGSEMPQNSLKSRPLPQN